MHPLDWSTIHASFDRIDQAYLCEPNLKLVNWSDIDFLSWSSPERHRSFLCIPTPSSYRSRSAEIHSKKLTNNHVGLVIRFHGQGTDNGLCDLCLTANRTTGTHLGMIDSFTTPRRSHGLHVCRDLDCSAAVRGAVGNRGLSETISIGQRIERLQGRLLALLQRLEVNQDQVKGSS